MASDNFQLDDLVAGASEKTNKINEIVQQFEDAVAEEHTEDINNAAYVVTDAEFNRFVAFEISSSTALTADRIITLPGRKKLLYVRNIDTTEFRIEVGPSGGTLGNVYAGERALLYCDGVDCRRIGVSPSSWLAVSGGVGFGTNWANVGGSWNDAAYRRNGGMVQLRGAVVNGVDTAPDTIFTLPANWRPAADQEFIVRDSANTPAVIRITSAGVVSCEVGTLSTRVHLDGIMF